LTRQEFDNLLSWLSPDREDAGRKYEEIRKQLVRFFTCWGCGAPDDLTDETIDRLVRWMEGRGWEASAEPIRVFYGFARNIRHEAYRQPSVAPMPVEVEDLSPKQENQEVNLHCLDLCLEKLAEVERELIRGYYAHAGRKKIEHRQTMAGKMGIGMNALRIQAWRIRSTLRDCIDGCLKQQAI
jgi:DNA-directed RNA polymerase specialized sigma24 family protein